MDSKEEVYLTEGGVLKELSIGSFLFEPLPLPLKKGDQKLKWIKCSQKVRKPTAKVIEPTGDPGVFNFEKFFVFSINLSSIDQVSPKRDLY